MAGGGRGLLGLRRMRLPPARPPLARLGLRPATRQLTVLERREELAGVRVAGRGVLLETAQDQLLQIRRDRPAERRRGRLRRGSHVLRQYVEGAVAAEDVAPDQQVVGDRA